MIPFSNPIQPTRGMTGGETLAQIQGWTRASIPAGDPVVSVSEMDCPMPGCPPRETVILVLWDDEQPWQFRVAKTIPEVTEDDIVWALRSMVRLEPVKRATVNGEMS